MKKILLGVALSLCMVFPTLKAQVVNNHIINGKDFIIWNLSPVNHNFSVGYYRGVIDGLNVGLSLMQKSLQCQPAPNETLDAQASDIVVQIAKNEKLQQEPINIAIIIAYSHAYCKDGGIKL